MTSTIRFEITEKEINSSDVATLTQNYNFIGDFENKVTGEYTQVSTNTFFDIDFTRITTATVIKISSSQDIIIRLNGSTEDQTVAKYMIFFGSFTSLQIKNNSGEDATINYEIFGS